MGADLYMEGVYEKNHAKYEANFKEAVKKRNEIIIPSELVSKINEYVHKVQGKTVDFFGNPLKVDENVELPASLRPYEKKYNEYCDVQAEVSKYHELMYSKGYFRDSYNGTSLFWRLGLSWWSDLGKFASKSGRLTTSGSKKLLKVVKETRLKPITEKELEKMGCALDSNNTVQDWRKFFRNKKKFFIRFLEQAIKEKRVIRCSV